MAPLQRGEPPTKKLGACIERGELQMDENKLKDELIARLSNNVDTTVLQMGYGPCIRIKRLRSGQTKHTVKHRSIEISRTGNIHR